MSELTQAKAKELLDYDPETGRITWKVSPCQSIPAGSPAGGIHVEGYLRIKVNYHGYLAHRLIFFMQTGRWPVGEIDHLDGNRLNNSWSNLRECSREENMKNKKKRKGSKGITGVSWHERSSRWKVHIGNNGKRISLYESCLLDAVSTRYRLERELGFTERHGK